MRAVNAAIFVPNAGCPHRCSFCDQRAISNTKAPPTADGIIPILQSSLRDLPRLRAQNTGIKAEIAFFGGSFTALPRDYMLSLLSAAKPFLGNGGFDGIRLSTRPDAINGEILQILHDYGVTTVELGAQSTDPEVLAANGRGHSEKDIFEAASAVKAAGFALGLQMMTGLYRSTPQKDLQTAKDLLSCKPDFMRVYPTAVFAGTELERLWRSGEYSPPGVEPTVSLCADILRLCDSAGVTVIRLGLHADISPDSQPLAGAFHPALGELVMGRIYLSNMLQALQNRPKNCYTVYVRKGAISAAVGQHRANLTALREHGWKVRVKTDDRLSGYEVVIGE